MDHVASFAPRQIDDHRISVYYLRDDLAREAGDVMIGATNVQGVLVRLVGGHGAFPSRRAFAWCRMKCLGWQTWTGWFSIQMPRWCR